MAALPSLTPLVGFWTGTSALNFGDGSEPKVSESNLSLDEIGGQFVVIRYDWVFDGETQQGELIASANEAGVVTAAWLDTFHQSAAPMTLVGTDFAVTGAYSAPGTPDWGWRIEIDATDDDLALTMTNITPDGEEEWAVRGVYSRAQNI